MIEAIKTDRTTRFADVPDSHLQIGVAGTLESEEQAQRWFQCVENEFPGMTLPYVHLPCSIACHVGMNAVGIGIIKKKCYEVGTQKDKDSPDGITQLVPFQIHGCPHSGDCKQEIDCRTADI